MCFGFSLMETLVTDSVVFIKFIKFVNSTVELLFEYSSLPRIEYINGYVSVVKTWFVPTRNVSKLVV